MNLLGEVSAPELLASDLNGTVIAVSEEYRAFDGPNDHLGVLALIDHNLRRKSVVSFISVCVGK